MTDEPPDFLTYHVRHYAFLGDAVFTLWIRELAVEVCQTANQLHGYASKRVKAETQAALLEKLMDELNETELDVVRRARNISVGAKRRSQQAAYRLSTAFEALIGYWHVHHLAQIPTYKKRVLTLLQSIEVTEFS